jgi:UDP-4-amino-4,6-dideoxy-N-acetyl-beta-L-altrosamine transaminase
VTKHLLPYGRQWIEDDDIEAVVRVLRSDYLTTGPEVEAFEAELAARCDVRHAIVVANGTAALHCAYAAAGLGAGDELITSPLTFSATANMALAVGATPVFADVRADTLCLDPERVAKKICSRTRALVPVDFAGQPAAMDDFMALAARHHLTVIEDAAHSIGSIYRGRRVGGLAHLTTMSFHPVKTITTGEGGAVLTNDDALARRARDFRNHGLVRDPERLGRNDGGWYYEVQTLGLNYRLSAIQCALGRSQLRKLDRFSARRAALVERYQQAFAGEPRVRMTESAPDVQPTWHLFTIRLENARVRAALYDGLLRRGIGAQVHYIAVNDLPLYRARGHRPEETPVAREATASLISLPLFPAMLDGDVDRVVVAVREALDELD